MCDLPTHDIHRPPPYIVCPPCAPACIPFQGQFTCLPFSLASFPAFLDAGSQTQNFTHAQQTLLPLSYSISPVLWINDKRMGLPSISFHIPRSPGGVLSPILLFKNLKFLKPSDADFSKFIHLCLSQAAFPVLAMSLCFWVVCLVSYRPFM